jgi:hypothetical protein
MSLFPFVYFAFFVVGFFSATQSPARVRRDSREL